MAGKISKSKSKKTSKAVKKANSPTKIKKATNKVAKKTKKIIAKIPISAKTKAKTSSASARSKTVTTSKLKTKTSTTTLAKKKAKAVAIKPTKVKSIVKKTSEKNISKPVKSSVAKTKPATPASYNLSLTQDISEVKDTSSYKNKTNLEPSEHLLTGPSNKFEPYRIESTEEYMNEQQLEHFRSILEAWKQDLMLEVDHTITEMKEADVLADPNDRATQEETFNLELRARDRERKLIKKIETALNKIQEHEYGYCETCGVEIGVRRLEARPTATLCIECKTLAEIREKRV